MNRSFAAVAFLFASLLVLASCTSTPKTEAPAAPQADPEVPKLKADLDALNKQIALKDASLADLIKQKDELARQKADLESKAAQLPPLQKDRDALAAKNAELQAQVVQLQKRVEDLDAKRAKLEADAAELRAAKDAAEARITQLEGDNADLKAIKSDLEGRLGQLDAFRKDKASFDAQKADLESQLGKMKSRAEDSEKKLAQSEAKADALTAENKRMWADFDSYKTRIAALEASIAKLQKDLDDKTAQANALDTKVGQLNKEKDLLSSSLLATQKDLQKKIADLAAEREGLQARIAGLEKDKAGLEAALQRSSLRLAEVIAQLKKELNGDIEAGNVEILQYENVLIVNVKDTVMFAPDRPELKSEFQPTLRKLAEVVKKVPEKLLRVEGNTAVALSSPEILKLYPTSWHLGAARAANVVDFLQEECGIDPLRLVATSFGEYRPIAENVTEAGKAKNRRVQFVLIDRPLYEIDQLKQAGK
jgi:flagellar motor protein MotB